MGENRLKRVWRTQCWICMWVFAAVLMVGALGFAPSPVLLLAVGGVFCVSVVLAGAKLRCPACGASVYHEAMRPDPDSVFFCSRCGARITLE